MGAYSFNPIITPATAEDTAIVDTTATPKPACLSVVGTLGTGETVDIQIPATTDPDPATDSDWIDFYQDDVQVQLTSTNHAVAVPVGLTVRVVKHTTALAVGVRWS